MKYYILLIGLLFTNHLLTSQNIFHGQIIDAISKGPIADATIVEFMTTNGTSSDSLGFFTIETKQRKPIFYASHVKFKEIRFSPKKKNKDNIELQMETANYLIGELNITPDIFESKFKKSNCDSVFVQNAPPDTIFTVIESLFEYPGGWDCLDLLFISNFEPDITSKNILPFGKLDINFNIDSNGYPSEISTNMEISTRLVEVLENIFLSMSQWKPASQRGHDIPVNVTYSLIYME